MAITSQPGGGVPHTALHRMAEATQAISFHAMICKWL